MKYFIAYFCLLALLESTIVTGLSCIKCGDDGKCQNNATEILTVCGNEEMTCMLKSESDDDGHTYDVKDCYNAPEHLKMVGCLKISSDMPGGENEHICLCAKDGCNEKMCPKERCDCAFADPDNCIHIDPSATPISCRHCEGEDCRDGKNGEYKPCTSGESSCIYVNAKVANNTIISRACFYEETGARLRGCVEVEEGDSFKGEICYCDTDDCNQQTCDNRFCDCAYSDPNKCIQRYNPNDPNVIQCKVCSGASCEDGENAKSEPCLLGEKSCLYGKTTIEYSPENMTTIISRSCAFTENNNIAMNGCIQVKEVRDVLNEPGFVGDYCYCDKDDCNKATCDPTQCSCAYADSNNCKGNGAEKNTLGIASFFILTSLAFLIV